MQTVIDVICDALNVGTNEEILTIDINDSVDTIKRWDSLVTVSIALAISSKFGLELDIDSLEEMTSVKKIISLVSESHNNKITE
jgi:acyl carrier protein